MDTTDRIPSHLRARAFAWHQFALSLLAAVAVLAVIGVMAIPFLKGALGI